ncbi:hypothetical protein ACVBE9_12210 [Eionea flava]
MANEIKELSEDSAKSLMEALSRESDRGAVVLAGSYIENLLALSLKSKLQDSKKSLVKNLFGANGACSTFSQRIDICEAFEVVQPSICKQLRAIKQIRNEFSHHPFEAKFTDEKINKLVCKLGLSKGMGLQRLKEPNSARSRECYLLACGLCIANITAYLSIGNV